MTARLFFLISALAFALTARAASTISFKDITSTNVVKTNDLFLLDSDLGGGNYATRTAPIALLPSGGDTIWTSSSNIVTTAVRTNYLYTEMGWNFGTNVATAWGHKADLSQGEFLYAYQDTAISGVTSAEMSIGAGTNGTVQAFSIFRADTANGPVIDMDIHDDAFIMHHWWEPQVSPSNGAFMIFSWDDGTESCISSLGMKNQFGAPWMLNSVYIASDDVLIDHQTNNVSRSKIYGDGSITTGGNPDRWIFKGLTIDGGGVTNVNYSVNGTNLTMGNVTSTGASVAGQFPAYANTDGKSVAPSSALPNGVTLNGQSIETQLTNKVAKAGDTMTGTLVTPLLSANEAVFGGMSVVRTNFTHAGTVTLDCSATNRYASITLTGNVTFATANLTAGRWFNMIITMTATNDTPTFPAWKWLGGAPSTLTASQIGVLSIYPTSTTDASTLAAYAETQ